MSKIIVKCSRPADGNAHSSYDFVEKETTVISTHKDSLRGFKNAINCCREARRQLSMSLGDRAVWEIDIEYEGISIEIDKWEIEWLRRENLTIQEWIKVTPARIP